MRDRGVPHLSQRGRHHPARGRAAVGAERRVATEPTLHATGRVGIPGRGSTGAVVGGGALSMNVPLESSFPPPAHRRLGRVESPCPWTARGKLDRFATGDGLRSIRPGSCGRLWIAWEVSNQGISDNKIEPGLTVRTLLPETPLRVFSDPVIHDRVQVQELGMKRGLCDSSD